jgi:hypothetical protein
MQAPLRLLKLYQRSSFSYYTLTRLNQPVNTRCKTDMHAGGEVAAPARSGKVSVHTNAYSDPSCLCEESPLSSKILELQHQSAKNIAHNKRLMANQSCTRYIRGASRQPHRCRLFKRASRRTDACRPAVMGSW